MKTTVIIFLLYYVVHCVFSQPPNDGMCNITFDPKNFIVHFAPWVRYEDKGLDEYREEDLIPMIKTISTRFRNIDFAPIDRENIQSGHSHIFIPTAVAKFNRNVSSAGQRSLQVILSWEILDNETSSSDNQYSEFTFTKELADKANLIFPGTVRTIMLFAVDLTEIQAEGMKNQIAFARSVIANGTYELGSLIYIKSCEEIDRWLQEFMKYSIQAFDKIFIRMNPMEEYSRYGVDMACKMLLRRYDKCKRKLQRQKPALKVGLSTYWSDTDYDGKQNISNLVRFWENMNKFAESTDTPVILLEAFDQPFRSEYQSPFSLQGWWKLNDSTTYWNSDESEEYIFDEKCTHAYNGVTYTDAVKTKPNETEPLIEKIDSTRSLDNGFGKFEIEVTSAILVVGLLISTIVYVYWKMRKYKNTIKVRVTEIQEFFEGRPDFSTDNPVDDEFYEPEIMAYDKGYEIALSHFKLDESVTLGSGEFGNVCLGKVLTPDMEISTAVKVAKKNSTVALKSLMCEIKVLSYIGLHENIVRFVGAYTAQLKKDGTLLLFLELCPNGSLLKYLRRHGNTISSEAVSYLELSGEDNLGATNVVDLKIMLQWCQDISKGMEYLVSKRLVHSDLASRNVLLDRDRRAKICDFGLSRRLYDYSSYIKTNAEPLPWRWMSPESLRRMEFNEKSDVWAFGVTVWEIFSFGDVPYPGLPWTKDFAMRLEAGLCLQQPANCPPDLYDKMLRCWNISPGSRPTFAQLTTEFVGHVGN